MKQLSLEKLETYNAGGDVVTGICYAVGVGTIYYAAGAMLNWWNPIGWVNIALLAIDGACIAYGLSTDE